MCLVHSITKEILPEVLVLTLSMLPACVLMKKSKYLFRRGKKSHLEQPYSMVSEEVARIYDLLITALHKTCLTA